MAPADQILNCVAGDTSGQATPGFLHYPRKPKNLKVVRHERQKPDSRNSLSAQIHLKIPPRNLRGLFGNSGTYPEPAATLTVCGSLLAARRLPLLPFLAGQLDIVGIHNRRNQPWVPLLNLRAPRTVPHL